MEVFTNNNKKTPLNKTHFARLHEKVHNKYEEMQKKLDKYREFNAMNDRINRGSEDVFRGIEHVSRSHEDLRDLGSDEENKLKAQYIVLQEVRSCEALPQDIESFERIESNTDDIKHDKKHRNNIPFNYNADYCGNLIYYTNSRYNVSLDSLNSDIHKYDSTSDLSIVSLKSSPKIPLRDKIGSKITAAMERRQREKLQYKRRRNITTSMEKLVLTNTTKGELFKMSKRMRIATLTIVLIEAKGLDEPLMSEEKSNAYYCRFRLGAEKCKSKFAKNATSEVKSWLEMFTMPIHEDNMLEVSLWNKENQDDFLGRTVIDISDIEKERTHEQRVRLEGGTQNAEIFLLLTISGTSLNTILDIDDYNDTEQRMKSIKRNFAWYHLADDYRDVGCLSVLVYGAKGLAGNDPFCVLELGNTRLQTQTEYKSTDPNWMKIFTFTVTDITSTLVVTVYDEGKNKIDMLGKISMPLLKIQNGEKRWYILKDKTQRERAKGDYPRICLEMRITWNPIKASIRVINAKEHIHLKSQSKLNRQVFANNLSRARAIISWITDGVKVIKECFEWESRRDSFVALMVWLTVCWFFQVWMLPVMFLIPFVWYRPQEYKLTTLRQYSQQISTDGTSDDIKTEKEEKKSLLDRINTLQEMTHTVQNYIGRFASLGESVKNLVNFTVPYLSWLAIIILVTIAIVMYLIPVKYIFMAWAINKFTRKILRPNRIPNNEILDLLSRVPDDEALLDCMEFTLDELEDT